jgi:hypothetical protein
MTQVMASSLTPLGLYLLLFRICFVPWASDAEHFFLGLTHAKGLALGA